MPASAARVLTAENRLEKRSIVGVRVHATSYADAAARITNWARAGESRSVCVAAVHSLMQARDDDALRQIFNQADLVTPDGMPLVWGLRLLGVRWATRVYGPDLTPAVLAAAEREHLPVGFYGGAPGTLERLLANLRPRFPRLKIAYACSPPFRELSPEEERETAREINASGARILFVGIGSPKQEKWMARQRGRVRAVMLGVGAAFDFLSGSKPQAPRWMMRAGLEWLFRLATEPRRLWKRYLYNNPRFVYLFLLQLLGWREFAMGGDAEPRTTDPGLTTSD